MTDPAGDGPAPPAGAPPGLPAGPEPPGFELPILLFAAFRGIIDQLHAELARHGHPDVRPAYGFAMQAIGPNGVTAADLGRRLGISKQAAGKTVDRLADLGYAERSGDAGDRRRKLVRLTPRGLESLRLAAAIFDRLRADWEQALGRERLRQFESDLHALVPADGFRLDVASWLGG